MKKLILSSILVGSIILAGCTTRTEYGACVGVGEKQNSKLNYKLSAWNIGLAIIFIEMVIPPVIVLVDETYCPVGKADESN